MADNVSIDQNNARFVDYPYDLRRDWWNALQIEKLKTIASRVRDGETVLDVGCNSGYLAEFLPNAEAHGVDLSPALVREAQRRMKSARVAPAEALPFDDASFDVVTMAGVIEYVFDPHLVMRELLRVARRAVVITADHENGIWGASRVAGHPFMVRGYTAESIHALCSDVGSPTWWSIVKDTNGYPQHYVVEVAHRG